MKIQSLDRCEVTVVVDNVTDILSTVPDSVATEVQNVVRAGAKELSGYALCCAHWGLSLAITAHHGSNTSTLLFDTGPAGDTFRRNSQRLGVDFASINTVVLSHGHWDHVGGVIEALELIRGAKGGATTPVHVNEGMFVRRGVKSAAGGVIPFAAVPDQDELETAGGSVAASEAERSLLDGTFYLSGEIPRVTSYEKGFPGHVKDTGSGWKPDPLILDERFAAVHVRDKGIIVFTACSHAGVVNVLRHARDVFDPVPLYGVIGGFHLSGADCEAIIPETVADLQEFNLSMIVPGHCTGWRAAHELVDALGENVVVPSAVGRLHRF